MEELIRKWIRETIQEYERAKLNQNYYKARQMIHLERALREMRDKLQNI